MDNIKISIILPVFNEEEYIKATLDSIFNQDFDDFEVIVVDDGSSDKTFDIVKETFENSDINNQIIRQENRGAGAARNKGISLARGEYIVFVDGDDYILTNHLKELYNPQYDFSLSQMVKKENNYITNPHIYDVDEITTKEFIKQELEMKIPFNFVQLSYKLDIIKKHNLFNFASEIKFNYYY